MPDQLLIAEGGYRYQVVQISSARRDACDLQNSNIPTDLETKGTSRRLGIWNSVSKGVPNFQPGYLALRCVYCVLNVVYPLVYDLGCSMCPMRRKECIWVSFDLYKVSQAAPGHSKTCICITRWKARRGERLRFYGLTFRKSRLREVYHKAMR